MNPETYIKKLQKLERELISADSTHEYRKSIEIEAEIEGILKDGIKQIERLQGRLNKIKAVTRECDSVLKRIEANRQKDFNKYA